MREAGEQAGRERFAAGRRRGFEQAQAGPEVFGGRRRSPGGADGQAAAMPGERGLGQLRGAVCYQCLSSQPPLRRVRA
ncbi:MAG TPA: hypothetical protein VFU74_12670 [Actinocrinis sp.]|nr:hypothetical protein [Actinocrinis sp.]